MKPKLLILLIISGTISFSYGQQWQLLKFSDNGVTSANVIARDEAGNTYIAGSFTDSLNFNNQVWGSQGNFDGFILSLNSDNVPRWIKTFGGTGAENLKDLEYRDGVIYVGGTYASASLNFQVTSLQNNSPGTNDCFVAALDTLGNYLWASAFGSSGTSEVTLRDIHVSGDAVFIAGSYQGIFDAGNGVLSASSGSDDAYLLKKDLNGISLWGRYGHGTGTDFLSAVTTDVFGNIYCTGAFGNLTGLGNASISIGSVQLTAIGGFGFYDMFVAKYDSAGIFQYALREGGTNYDIPGTILVDGNKLLIGGTYYFTTILNGISYNTNGGNEGFVYCLDTAMIPQWSTVFTTTSGSTSYYDDIITDIKKQGNNQYFVLNQLYAYGLEISLINGSGIILNSEKLLSQHNSTSESAMVADGSCGRLFVTSSFTDSLKSSTDTITGGYADAFIAIRTDSSLILPIPQNISGTAPDTICSDYPLFSISVDPLAGAVSYGWQVLPPQAGTITGLSNQVTLNVNDNFSGSVGILCYGASACATSPPSDTLHYFVKLTPSAPTILQNGLNLTASTINSSYIWYYNGNVIPNENGISISATANGAYQVAAVSDGCVSALSPFVSISNVGLAEHPKGDIRLRPNPASDIVYIQGDVREGDELLLVHPDGRLSRQERLSAPFAIHTTTMEKGFYMVELLRNGKRIAFEKLILLK